MVVQTGPISPTAVRLLREILAALRATVMLVVVRVRVAAVLVPQEHRLLAVLEDSIRSFREVHLRGGSLVAVTLLAPL